MSAARTLPFRGTRFGSPGAGSLSHGIPAAAYPGRVATNSDLIVAVDQQQTTLLLPVGVSDLTITVLDPSSIAAYNLLSIDSEIVKTIGPPAGNVIPVARGFDGTLPAAHVSGAIVAGFIDAYHHNALVAEVEAIETFLGPNGSNIVSPTRQGPIPFAAQQPGGSLVVGANAITMAPVPAGVNGTDVNHYLWVSGGAGTAEAALITGGSGVAGEPSGQIIITCANTHSGAWTIQSATSGIQEAIVNQNPSGAVYLPSMSFVLHAPVYNAYGVSIIGAGENSVLLPDTGVINPVVVESPNNSGYGAQLSLSSFSIEYASIPASGSALTLRWLGDAQVNNIRIYSAYNGLQLSGAVRLQATNLSIVARNYALWLYGTPAELAAGMTAAGQITNLRILNATIAVEIDCPTAGFHINGIFAECDPINFPMLAGINFNSAGTGAINEFIVTGGFLDGVTQNAILTNPATPIITNGVIVTNLRIFGYGSQAIGVSLFGVSQFKLMNNYILVANQGVRLSAVSGCQVTGNTILAEVASMQGLIMFNACVDNMIQNNLIGANSTGGSSGAIATYGLAADATAHSHNTVAGNKVCGSTAPMSWSSTGTDNTITANPGVDSVWPTIASAATVSLPPAPFASNFLLSGNVAVTAVAGFSSLADGVQGTFIPTGTAPGTWTAGATIGNTFTPVTNKPVRWTVKGGVVYLS